MYIFYLQENTNAKKEYRTLDGINATGNYILFIYVETKMYFTNLHGKYFCLLSKSETF